MPADAPRPVLVAVDGSDESLRAVDEAVRLRRRDERIAIHLINVQPPLRADVAGYVPARNVRDHHREEAAKALDPARARLAASGAPGEIHIAVGKVGEMVAAFARDLGVELVIVGTRGLGRAASAVLGSSAQDVVRHAPVPVLLVK